MTFIHGYLLGGLLLAGLPVLLHLMLRQKPRQLPFPAFRFLKARQRTNQRKLRLQHFLLLALRVGLLALLCLALARPRIFTSRLGLGRDRPVVAALLFDTSASMEYAVAGTSLLDRSKQRAREVLDEMDAGSSVAVVDAGDEAAPVLLGPAEARSRLDSLRLRPGAGALNQSVDRVARLLEKQPAEEGSPPRLLYIFSDRTRACWDSAGLRPRLPEGVTLLFVDVGVEKPRDLGIERVEIVPAVVAPGARYEVRVSLRGTPGGHENELVCQADQGDPERRPVRLEAAITQDAVVFERIAPMLSPGVEEMPVQLALRLTTRDALPGNNLHQATFLVRGGRKLLTLTEKPDDRRVRIWEAAHAATRHFACEIRTLEEANALTPQQLSAYAVVALFEVESVSDAWWRKLADFVRAGCGLAIVPAGEELLSRLDAFNKGGLAAGVLPAAFEKLTGPGADGAVKWERFSGAHPLLAPFVAWSRSVDPDFERDDLRPFVRRYWQLGQLAPQVLAISRYADKARNPALAERYLGKGRCIAFTSPLDFRFVDERKTLGWNNYWTDSSFGLVLVDRVCRYLGGEVAPPVLNFNCGVVPSVSLATIPLPPISIVGPGLVGAERTVRQQADGLLTMPQATLPGNYQVLDGKLHLITGFSLDLPSKETDLTRIADEEIVALFGAQSLVQAGQSVSLREALAQTHPAPVELLPYLMSLVLLVLTGESVLANRFYRRQPDAARPEGEAQP